MKELIKKALVKAPILRMLRQRMRKNGAFPAGHYYSPVPDKKEVSDYIAARKPVTLQLPDVRLNKERQSELLNQYCELYRQLPFPEERDASLRYYYNNQWFSYSDAIFLYCFLRKHNPKRIIEVGSGFSSAVMLDTADRFLERRPDITFIEPNPERLKSLLRKGDEKSAHIIERKIQEVPMDVFASMEAGDLLFIDSSHVIKCGSDLQCLMFEVLPQLPAGVFVHFHDVFYPFDYPPEWLEEGRYWNENYFLRAFLSFNEEWSIHWFNSYVALAFNEFLRDNMPLCLRNSGGSLYIQRNARTD